MKKLIHSELKQNYIEPNKLNGLNMNKLNSAKAKSANLTNAAHCIGQNQKLQMSA